MKEAKFEVLLLRSVIEFFDEIDPGAHKKLLYNIHQARNKLDPRLFKKVDSVFWEFRAEHKRMQYRVLAFWHRRGNELSLVVATHGFIKKTDKLPGRELDRAYAIRTKYLRDGE